MSFRVQNNIRAMSSLHNLNENKDKMAKLVERLSSGKRINDASDDAAGLAASMRMRAEIGSLTVAVQNTMEAGAALQTADGAMNQSGEILIRMKELATQAASGNTQNTSAINNEMSMLQNELDRIAGATTYGDRNLVDGSYSSEFQVGDNADASSQLQLNIGDISTASLNGGGAFNVSAASQGDAIKALDSIDSALNYLANQRAEVGTMSNRVNYQQNNLSVSIENKVAAESMIADADMAKTMMEFTKTQILVQADTAMLAQANMTPGVSQLLMK